jgi:predicted Holliday junction resolvase-like endonuclease
VNLKIQDIKKNLRGCLKNDAKPELMDLEKSAWQEAVKEKYISDYTQWRQNLDTNETIEEISQKALALRTKIRP